MNGQHRNRIQEFDTKIVNFRYFNQALLGVQDAQARLTLIRQIIDSLRRTDFVRTISRRPGSPSRCQPGSPLFDPLKAAVYYRNRGDFDEAHWITFLGTHCGKHEQHGWHLTATLYGAFQPQPYWTWARVSQHPENFLTWLAANQASLLDPDNNLKFSNHRKYESLNVNSRNNTGQVVASYVRWIAQYGDHRSMINNIQREVGQNPTEVFDGLYGAMTRNVLRFGRLGAFDHICMAGKLDLAPVEPGKAYIGPATGPRRGANLLFHNDPLANTPAGELEAGLQDFGGHLGIGMQEVEDSLCNWQKSPNRYEHFRG
ncbi:alpha-glutamyl/putrescinyl thymine pyrophosphorylase clade 3 protein [Limimaricola soesokkakensis]|uniref:alpha-glutamyl/putrescinyl thymine pyrophosphorylase clade 3 protein n=1 Tax=Limimaricola soesokkakensis TaxID=1343159 RepID=UPI0035137C73